MAERDIKAERQCDRRRRYENSCAARVAAPVDDCSWHYPEVKANPTQRGNHESAEFDPEPTQRVWFDLESSPLVITIPPPARRLTLEPTHSNQRPAKHSKTGGYNPTCLPVAGRPSRQQIARRRRPNPASLAMRWECPN